MRFTIIQSIKILLRFNMSLNSIISLQCHLYSSKLCTLFDSITKQTNIILKLPDVLFLR